MKQLWLVEPTVEKEQRPEVPLDPRTRNELLSLMATAIETVHIQQTQGETKDAPVTVSHEDYGTAPLP